MLLADVVNLAIANNCSDIHLMCDLPPTFRKNGEIVILKELIGVNNKEIIQSMLNPEQVSKLNKGDDLDFAVTVSGQRIRVNVFRQQGKISAVLRLLNGRIPTMEELGVPEILKTVSLYKRGLVLITGPTGSGKSTTLASMINYINMKKHCHILTIEDPVEYLHKPKNSIISQREVGHDVESFSSALRSALRQDPDVILVGEMRDFETISLAVTAAETGHLVFGTLHTMGAANTIDRIIDVFPAAQQNQIRAQLASCLKAVITQQLVVKQDKSSRVGVFEVMLATEAIQSMIRENKIHMISSTMQTGSKMGMQTMDAALAELVKHDIIDRDTAMSSCVDKDNFKRLLI